MRLQDIGCLCCIKKGYPDVPVDVHHLVDKGYREHSGGDAATLPICPWHHRGVPPFGLSADQAYRIVGPSLALHPGEFVEAFGDQRTLLLETDILIDALERRACLSR
jgi:hypothetical protein